MTPGGDEPQLDAQWRGTSDVSRRYRQLSVDTVPEELDQLILQQARAALTETKHSPSKSWIRWGVPLAFAASALLAATVMLEGARTPPTGKSPQAETREPPPSATASIAPEGSNAVPQIAAPARLPATEKRAALASSAQVAGDPGDVGGAQAAGGGPRVPAATQLQPSSAAVASPLEAVVVTGSYIRGSAEDAALPIDAISAAELTAAPIPANTATAPLAEHETPAQDSDALQLTPALPVTKVAAAERRLDRIREMREVGRKRAADAAWRSFLQDYPDYPVAAEDIARTRAP